MLALDDVRHKTVLDGDFPNWRDAVTALLAFWITEGRCFSSGEVATALRTHRSDLRFSVLSVGEFLRYLFYNQTMPLYTMPDGSSVAAMQMPRFTEGRFPDRTPQGTEVFVYGPDQDSCTTHDFEVFIPKPHETMADAPAPQAAKPLPAGQTPVSILGDRAGAAADLTAKVWPDGRLCVPRSAFELTVHLSGTPLRGGDPVFVTVNPTEATVSLTNPDGTAKQYNIWVSQGRVAFPSPDPAKPFKAGDTYKITVEAGKLTVDLSSPAA